MAGVKGRSGRRPGLDDKTVQTISRLSAFYILHAFRAPEEKFSYEKKVELAKTLVVRMLPQNVAFSGEAPLFQILMNPQSREGVQENNRLVIAQKANTFGEV